MRKFTFKNLLKKTARLFRSKKFRRFILFAVLAFLIFVPAYIFSLAKNLPSIGQIETRKVNESTKIYDKTGKVLLYEIAGEERRTVVSSEKIPKYAKDATIAIEDEKFYEGPAFDWRAMIRAAAEDLIHGQLVQGASTITQQLAKNAFLSSDKTISRKIKEVFLAIKLNNRYTKDQILTLYLNEVPYGSNVYGIEAASETYFGKTADELTIAESAVLAAMLQAPSYYSPWGTHQKELFSRAQLILKKLKDAGKINNVEFVAASSEKMTFLPPAKGIRAPHFVMAVEDYLSQKYSEDAVRNGGLRVITTLDWDLQRAAEKAVLDGARRNEKLYNGKNAALVAEDPKTGQILAMVGSRDYFDTSIDGNFNVATQGLRQPGSALKPFVYLLAFKKGYTPDTVIFDVPTEFSNIAGCKSPPDYENDNPNCFHPKNFDERFVGPIKMKNALAESRNVPATKTLYLAGLKDAVGLANDFGISTLTNSNIYGLSLVLGGGAVKLIDLVGAYSALSQDGVRHDQSLVLEIKDKSGNVLELYKDNSEQVVEPEYPRLINDILSDPDLRTPLYQNSLGLTVFPDYDVALKTGTSNDYHDAWTMGYTPFLVTGVWAGNNDNSPMQRSGSSILAAVPIWHDFMAEALKKYIPETFTKPDPLVAEKPVLHGECVIENQIHSILYYVDKNNPAGPEPQNPGDDPQFDNWESSVVSWASVNVPGFNNNQNNNLPTNQAYSPGGNYPPKINIISPSSGSFVGQLIGSSPLSDIKIYWNGYLLGDYSAAPYTNYTLNTTVAPPEILNQNTLGIEVKDEKGLISRGDIIVYKSQ